MSTFEIVRTATIGADPARVHGLIDDFRAWAAWSPWEEIDPQMQRVYSGADSGVGAHYAWLGNRKAGQGSMEITSSTPECVEIALEFLKPWKASNQIVFELTPTTVGTEVAWRMTGEQKGLSGLFMRLYNMDRLVGGDFERGLARLKTVAEQR